MIKSGPAHSGSVIKSGHALDEPAIYKYRVGLLIVIM